MSRQGNGKETGFLMFSCLWLGMIDLFAQAPFDEYDLNWLDL